MYKIFISLCVLFALNLGASEINWAKDFKAGMAEAKKLKKPVMFVSSRHSCKYCVILEETTFKNAMVVKDLNDNFITIVSYSDDNDYMPKKLWRPGTPAIWFLNYDGVPMFQELMGALSANDLLNVLPQVKQEFEALQKKEKNDFYKLKK